MTVVNAYVGIGSNLGDRKGYCLAAVERIKQDPRIRSVACSAWSLTRPVGVNGQGWFVNGVASLWTDIPAGELLNRLLSIELDLGRVRKEHWGARVIDLDLLLYGDRIIREENLEVPHPRMHVRRFVLAPMAQLAPGLVHPAIGLTMAQLLERLPKDGQDILPLREGIESGTEEERQGV